MRRVDLLVGSTPIGQALTWAYPGGASLGTFSIATYKLTVSGVDDMGIPNARDFEVFRFGLKSEDGRAPRVVGLADQQTHVIKQWLPNYTVRSANSLEQGAWQVYDNFLIHDGPDDPKREVYASVGCIEVCNGPQGFDLFNDFIIALAGSKKSTRAEKLAEIGSSSQMIITYQKAIRPSFEKIN